MGFKDNLKMLRKSKKLSQKEFGELINKTLLTVSRYENGILFPKHSTLTKICDVLGVSVGEILSDIKYEKSTYTYEEIKEFLKQKHLDTESSEFSKKLLQKNDSKKSDTIYDALIKNNIFNKTSRMNDVILKEIDDMLKQTKNNNLTTLDVIDTVLNRDDILKMFDFDKIQEKRLKGDLRNDIYNFYLLLKYDLLTNNDNIPFNTRKIIFENLVKYYSFLINDYKKEK